VVKDLRLRSIFDRILNLIERLLFILLLATTSLVFNSRSKTASLQNNLALPQEKHLRNVKQLTFGGENAEAYFSADGKKLIFQSTRDGRECDQIYTMNIDGTDVRLVSTGEGRTTCSYFFPNGKKLVFASNRNAKTRGDTNIFIADWVE